jgi:BirA family transcriptional regulator, biotin operon repressor / biotin---[acetyl-CoA-carboxylase] ligase
MSTATAVTWDGQTAESLADFCGAPSLELLVETASTLDVAHVLAERGAPAGTVVLADSQRAGRGRHGRAWSSKPGQGVWSTIIERPTDAAALDVLSIRVGLGCAEALDPLAGARVDVKWPNDLLVGGAKLGGILVEARWTGGAPAWVAIGIGVNVQTPMDVGGATGLPEGVARADVLRAIVQATRVAAGAKGHLAPAEMERYRRRDALIDRTIEWPAAGTVTGIAASGALVVRASDGHTEHHRTGTVRFAEGT